jgi:hypothetical protein
VVASRIGQIAPLVDAGFVVPAEPGRADALERALEAVLSAPGPAAAAARRGREWVLRERTWSANARHAIALAAQRGAAGAATAGAGPRTTPL